MPKLEYNDVAKSSEYRAKFKDYSKDPGWYGRLCGDLVERRQTVRQKGKSDVLNNCIAAGITPWKRNNYKNNDAGGANSSTGFRAERMKQIQDDQLKFRWEPPMTF